MSDFDADAIVIGSGPAGVSAAIPLVEAGKRVLMLDGAAPEAEQGRTPLCRALGERLEALVPDDGLSPKWRTPVARGVMGAFHRAADLDAENFLAVGSLARGGLSRVWGGFVAEFDAHDLAGWPITTDELAASYRAVTARVGISGSTEDDLAGFLGRCGPLLPAPPLGPAAAAILARYRAGKPESGFALGLARNALLTNAQGDRLACDYSLGCLLGCERGAIYDARHDLALLRKSAAFRLRAETVVRLVPVPGGWQAVTNGARSSAPRIAVAAGALGTLRLVAPLLDVTELRLLNCPVLAMPLLVAARLGKKPPERGFTLAQLGFRLAFSPRPGDTVTGGVYELAALPPSAFAAKIPLGRRAATELFRYLASALVVATAYFPGRHSDNRVTLRRDGESVRIHIRGGVTAGFDARRRDVERRLARIWRRLGTYALPGATLATAGTDAHFGGLFPMGAAGPAGTSRLGELNAAPGLFLVDGAVLPSVPSKFTTLTIMANADRIGREIARMG